MKKSSETIRLTDSRAKLLDLMIESDLYGDVKATRNEEIQLLIRKNIFSYKTSMNGPKVNTVALVKLNYLLEHSRKDNLLIQKQK